ncbi:MAG: hypothetical protein AAF604_00605 [Acidobacteriota bacterium]
MPENIRQLKARVQIAGMSFGAVEQASLGLLVTFENDQVFDRQLRLGGFGIGRLASLPLALRAGPE